MSIAFCLEPKPREVVLRNVEFDLEIVQIGQRDHLSLRTALGAAGELRRYQLTLLCRAFQNRSGDRGADHRSIKPRLGIRGLSFGLEPCAFGSRDFLLPGTDLRQIECLL